MDTNIVRYDLCMHHAYIGKLYSCAGQEYEGITWAEPELPKPTREELQVIWETIKDNEQAKERNANRFMAYPKIDELVVALWEKLVEQDGLSSAMINDIQQRRAEVKALYPKG